MLTVGKLKELIKNMPDEALVLQDDPHSEFSYNIVGSSICYTKLSHTTYDGENYYESWNVRDFNNLIEDNPDEEEEIKNEYKQALLVYLEDS